MMITVLKIEFACNHLAQASFFTLSSIWVTAWVTFLLIVSKTCFRGVFLLTIIGCFEASVYSINIWCSCALVGHNQCDVTKYNVYIIISCSRLVDRRKCLLCLDLYSWLSIYARQSNKVILVFPFKWPFLSWRAVISILLLGYFIFDLYLKYG